MKKTDNTNAKLNATICQENFVNSDGPGAESFRREENIKTLPNSSNSKRQVLCQDAVEWLCESSEPFQEGSSVFTSLPDISEIESSLLKGISDPLERIQVYEEWFIKVSRHILNRLPNNAYAIFLQSPVRAIDAKTNKVLKYIDKSHLLAIAVLRTNCVLMWKKMTINSVLDKRSFHRPTYSDLICFGKGQPKQEESLKGHLSDKPTTLYSTPTYNTEDFAVPDIIQRGEMLWPKGVGIDTAILGIQFLKYAAKASLVIDPFCGVGTILAVANYYGLDSFGVEISPKRSKQSFAKQVDEEIKRIPSTRLKLLGVRFSSGKQKFLYEASIIDKNKYPVKETRIDDKNSHKRKKDNYLEKKEENIRVDPAEYGEEKIIHRTIRFFVKETWSGFNWLRIALWIIFSLIIIYS